MKKITATGIFAMINVFFIGLQGIVHGISEISKGNIPTGGMLLSDIGAITFVQNYLLTGILTVISGVLLIILAVFFVQRRFFVPVFTLLCIALFMTGGGVGFVPFFIITVIAGLQANGAFGFVTGMVSGKAGQTLAKYWFGMMLVSFGCVLIGMMIWLFFLPPVEMHTGNKLQYVCWAFLAAGLISYIPTLFACHAKDNAGVKS